MTAYQHTSDFLHFRLCSTPQNVSIMQSLFSEVFAGFLHVT